MTLILFARKHPRDALPRCQAVNSRRQQCEFRAVVCINGKWYCRHPKHQPKEKS